MLEIVQFENGRYGLRHISTGIVVDQEWRTVWGVRRFLRKRDVALKNHPAYPTDFS